MQFSCIISETGAQKQNQSKGFSVLSEVNLKPFHVSLQLLTKKKHCDCHCECQDEAGREGVKHDYAFPALYSSCISLKSQP